MRSLGLAYQQPQFFSQAFQQSNVNTMWISKCVLNRELKHIAVQARNLAALLSHWWTIVYGYGGLHSAWEVTGLLTYNNWKKTFSSSLAVFDFILFLAIKPQLTYGDSSWSFLGKRLPEVLYDCLSLCSNTGFSWWSPSHILTRADPAEVPKADEMELDSAIQIRVVLEYLNQM